MIKLLPAAKGALTAALPATAGVMQANAGLTAYLQATLMQRDWGYLLLQDKCSSEVVRAGPVLGGKIPISRGLEGTAPTDFSAGASISPVETVLGIQDRLDITHYTTLFQRVTDDASQRETEDGSERVAGGETGLGITTSLIPLLRRVYGGQLRLTEGGQDRGVAVSALPVYAPLIPGIVSLNAAGGIHISGTSVGWSMDILGIGGVQIVGGTTIEAVNVAAGCECLTPPGIPLKYAHARITDDGAHRGTPEGAYRVYHYG